tara:strand:+ start:4742 stop:6775 length:2034 start_codon:yes stop_codon:yes gene_type:complete
MFEETMTQQVNGKWYHKDMSPADIMEAERINAARQGSESGDKTRGEQFNEDWIDPWSKIDDDDNWLQRIGKTAADWTAASPMKLGSAIGDQIEDLMGNNDGKEKEWRVNPFDFTEGGGEDFWNAVFSYPAFKAGKIAMTSLPALLKTFKTGGKPALDRYMREIVGKTGFGARGTTSAKQLKNKFNIYPSKIGWKERLKGATYPATIAGVGMASGPLDNPFDDEEKSENATVVEAGHQPRELMELEERLGRMPTKEEFETVSDGSYEDYVQAIELARARVTQGGGQTLPGQPPESLDPNIDRLDSWKTAREFLEGGMADHKNFDPSLFPNDPAHGIDQVALRQALQGDVDTHQIGKYHQKLKDLENRSNVVDSHQDLIDDWKASKGIEGAWSEQDKMKWIMAYTRGELDDFKLKRTPFTDKPPSLDDPSPTPKPGPGTSPTPKSGDESLGFGGSTAPWAQIGLTGGALALWLASRGKVKPKFPKPPAQLGLPNRVGNFTMPGAGRQSTPFSKASPYNPPRPPKQLSNSGPRPGQPRLSNKQPRLDNARPNFSMPGGPNSPRQGMPGGPRRPQADDVFNMPGSRPRLQNTRPNNPYSEAMPSAPPGAPGVQVPVSKNWPQWMQPKGRRQPTLDDFGANWWDDALAKSSNLKKHGAALPFVPAAMVDDLDENWWDDASRR